MYWFGFYSFTSFLKKIMVFIWLIKTAIFTLVNKYLIVDIFR